MVTVSRDVENNDNNSILEIACKIELIMIKLKIGIFLLTFCKKYIYMYDYLLLSFLLIMLFNKLPALSQFNWPILVIKKISFLAAAQRLLVLTPSIMYIILWFFYSKLPGEEGNSTKFCTGKLCTEVQPLTLVHCKFWFGNGIPQSIRYKPSTKMFRKTLLPWYLALMKQHLFNNLLSYL